MTYEVRHTNGAPEDDGTYFMWLLSKVGGDEIRWSEYILLFQQLMDTNFTYDRKIDQGKDQNRAIDGINLRVDYEEECLNDVYNVSGKCTVLEMLVGLACRIETDIMGEPGEDDPERWFELFLSNLGLLAYTDDHYDENQVQMILDDWMKRRISRNGQGGLFPLKDPYCKDQRHVEIWQQMQSYLLENYPID